jgi:hypothetical protein
MRPEWIFHRRPGKRLNWNSINEPFAQFVGHDDDDKYEADWWKP